MKRRRRGGRMIFGYCELKGCSWKETWRESTTDGSWELGAGIWSLCSLVFLPALPWESRLLLALADDPASTAVLLRTIIAQGWAFPVLNAVPDA
ncbi:hypothetical protein BHM03_00047105 [Ensete ventricosum]|nr:hypothetical protein BHM03_00047105 [Ensete ventricosum]